MEWIKIEDKLPENGIEVLVYGKYYYDVPVQAFVWEGVWKASIEVTDSMINCDRIDSRISCAKYITHWMPLPEPPKE